MAYLARSGCWSESSSNPERGLHPPLSDVAQTHKVSHSHKLLHQSPQEPLPAGSITSAYRQKRSRVSAKSDISGIFQPTIFSPKTKQQLEAYTRSEQTKSFPQGGKIQDETPETIRISLQKGEWVTSIDFKDAYFHIPLQEQSRKYMRFHVQDQTYQFKAPPFGLSTAPLELTVVAKKVKQMAIRKGIRIHQYLDDWLVRGTSHQVCLQHTQDLVKICQEIGWLVNLEKSELELAECGSRQAIQTRPDHPNRVVCPSRGLPSSMQQVAPASNRPICHKVQQVASACVTGTRSPGHSSGCTQSAMVGS